MRDYGKVYSSFWTSETTRTLSDRGRVLALYLLSGPHANMIGCYRLPDGYVAEDLSWTIETVAEGFSELFEKGFATRDSASKWVFVHSFLKWNDIENPNQAIPAIKLASGLPDAIPFKGALLLAVKEAAERFGDKIKPDVWNPFVTLCETVLKPGTGTGTGTGTEAGTGIISAPGTVCEHSPPAVVPPADQEPAGSKEPPEETALQAACRETWHAYAEAYAVRYGAPPVRNKTINSQIKQFVQRVAHAEAPGIAAFYVQHNDRRYVSAKHQVGLLLANAEALRTDWVTGRPTTQTQAAQADRTQATYSAAQQAKQMLHEQGVA